MVATQSPVCPVCEKRHEILTPERRSVFAQLGMTEDELDAIEAEDAAICGTQPVQLKPVKPSSTPAARAARKRKSRAAKAAKAGD